MAVEGFYLMVFEFERNFDQVPRRFFFNLRETLIRMELVSGFKQTGFPYAPLQGGRSSNSYTNDHNLTSLSVG